MKPYSHEVAAQYVINRIKKQFNNDIDFMLSVAPRGILKVCLEYHIEYLRSLKGKGKKK